jgi:polyhydroxybutyrate depolymerase
MLAASVHLDTQSVTLRIDGVERTALIFAPTVPSPRPPVVFAFHGHMGNSQQASRSYEIQREWPNAVVVYPQGLPTPTPLIDPEGKYPGWALEGQETNRDIHFFDGLFSDVMRKFHGDPKHVFAMGHSNGGAFIYTLWALRGDKFAGFASAEAGGARRFNLQPKPIFVTIGKRDQIVRPAMQHLSFNEVLRINQASEKGSPFGAKGTLYQGKSPSVLWEYDGTHAFPRDSVPSMVAFFKSLF